MAVLEAHFTGETNEANDLAEAVIISGPRKGEFIAVGRNVTQETTLSPEQEAEANALIDRMFAATAEISATIKEMRANASAFQEEMQARKKEHDELVRSFN